MKYFVFKLLGPRPTFPQDMTPREAQLMQDHAAYWRGLLDRGRAILFGPVGDPAGVYGLGILALEDGGDPGPIGANDPTILANAGFRFEIHPMLQAVVRS